MIYEDVRQAWIGFRRVNGKDATDSILFAHGAKEGHDGRADIGTVSEDKWPALHAALSGEPEPATAEANAGPRRFIRDGAIDAAAIFKHFNENWIRPSEQ
jgi:hypothetical protein